MDYLLVDKMGDELETRLACVLVVAAVCLLKLDNDAMNDKLNVFRQLCIDGCKKSSVDGRKQGTCCLRLHDCFGEQAFAAYEVFVEQLHYDVRNVRRVHFVDNSIDGLPEHFPHVLLVFFGVGVGIT